MRRLGTTKVSPVRERKECISSPPLPLFLLLLNHHHHYYFQPGSVLLGDGRGMIFSVTSPQMQKLSKKAEVLESSGDFSSARAGELSAKGHRVNMFCLQTMWFLWQLLHAAAAARVVADRHWEGPTGFR